MLWPVSCLVICLEIGPSDIAVARFVHYVFKSLEVLGCQGEVVIGHRYVP